jgi:hypothetical protein
MVVEKKTVSQILWGVNVNQKEGIWAMIELEFTYCPVHCLGVGPVAIVPR